MIDKAIKVMSVEPALSALLQFVTLFCAVPNQRRFRLVKNLRSLGLDTLPRL